MMKILSASVVAALLALPASAASFDTLRPVGASYSATFDLSYDVGSGQFVAFDDLFLASVVAYVSSDGSAISADPNDLVISDATTFADEATGRLLEVRFSEGLLELLFDTVDQDAGDSDVWDPYAIASFAIAGFDPAQGLAQLDLGDGSTLSAAGSIQAAAVPVPAALPLLAGALAIGGLAVFRRA